MKKILILLLILVSTMLMGDLKFGIGLYEDGLYEEAIMEFENIVDAAPTSEEAQESIFWIGESYRAKGLFKDAESSYRRLLEGYPESNFKDRTLAALGDINYVQKKFSKAVVLYQQLLDKYPLSEFSKNILGNYVDCFYQLGDYNSVILRARRILRDYEKFSTSGSVTLTLAKAYFDSNLETEGEAVLAEIPEKYPFQNARWDALELSIERIHNKQGILPAISNLQENLLQNIPRAYDENFRLLLIEYNFEIKDYTAAANELAIVLEKFSNSDRIDEYITRFAEVNLQLKRYEIIPNMYLQNTKIFEKSSYRNRLFLYVSESYLHQNQFAEANEMLKNVKAGGDGQIKLEAEFLQGKIYTKEGKYRLAIDTFGTLINSSFSFKEEVLFRIGRIYSEQFGNFATAIKYYQQLITSYPESEYFYRSYYRTALCYEVLGKIDVAVSELKQVNLKEVKDGNLRNKIEEKRSYLLKFKQKNYDIAFEDLLSSLFAYLEDDNRDKLQQDIIDIYAYDLKEINRSLELIDPTGRPDLAYKKAGLLLGLVEKKKAEAKEYNSIISEVNEIVLNLDANLQAEWISELKLKRSILLEKDDVNLVQELEDFVAAYPNSPAINYFLHQIYLAYKQENSNKAAVYADQMKPGGLADISIYYQVKIELAEYYYGKDNDVAALNNYRKADEQIYLQYPDVYFHYAVTLDQSGKEVEAYNRLDLLVKNAENYSNLKNAIGYYATRLHEKNEFAKAVEIKLLIPDAQRDDEFYQTLADDYLAIGNKEDAKISLLRIQNKDNTTMEKLGKLQFETGEYDMARYTFTELTKKDPAELRFYEYLGRIEFSAENFFEATEKYKIIYDKLGDNLSSYNNVDLLVKEYVISLYRVKNRPKAEAVRKRAGKVLSEITKAEIKLNEAAYYTKTEPKKAGKILTNFIKNQSNTELISQAYYWRGIAFAKQEKTTEAEADFKLAVKKGNIDLQNQANLKLGTINFTKDNYQEALGYYYKVIQQDEKGELARDAATNFAYVCKVLGKWQDAVAAYEIILERWGDQGLESETVFNIAFCHYRDKKYNKAVEMFRQALDILEDKEMRAETQYWIGESYLGEEKFENAISEFLKVGYNYPEFTQWAASAELKAGEAYVRNEKPAKARRIFERVIDKYGAGSRWGVEAKKQMKNL